MRLFPSTIHAVTAMVDNTAPCLSSSPSPCSSSGASSNNTVSTTRPSTSLKLQVGSLHYRCVQWTCSTQVFAKDGCYYALDENALVRCVCTGTFHCRVHFSYQQQEARGQCGAIHVEVVPKHKIPGFLWSVGKRKCNILLGVPNKTIPIESFERNSIGRNFISPAFQEKFLSSQKTWQFWAKKLGHFEKSSKMLY